MLTTYPDSNNLSTYAAGFSQKADFGRFHSTGLQFDDYTASSRGLTAANWGGNRTIRTATRRLHAGRQLLMLPNPHRCRCGECRRVRRARPLGPWAVAGPGCRARGRRRGLAGLRDDAPSEARGADGSRAGRRPRAQPAARPKQTTRRPEHRWRHKQHDAPRHAETPPRGCGTGLSLPSRV